jgi:hypothetical protein
MSIAQGVMLACGGFLLAVLWMDLIFDVQVRERRGDQVSEQDLASIAGYYHRATTTSRPMSLLIAGVMMILLGALIIRAVNGHDPAWVLVTSAVLAVVPILLAATRTVSNAVRLGHRQDDQAAQSRLARSIYRDHVLCFGCLVTFLIVLLARVR